VLPLFSVLTPVKCFDISRPADKDDDGTPAFFNTNTEAYLQKAGFFILGFFDTISAIATTCSVLKGMGKLVRAISPRHRLDCSYRRRTSQFQYLN